MRAGSEVVMLWENRAGRGRQRVDGIVCNGEMMRQHSSSAPSHRAESACDPEVCGCAAPVWRVSLHVQQK